MDIEIIAVGNEVVFGHTVNTNAAFIAQAVETVGYQVKRHVAVIDSKEAISGALEQSMKNRAIIFVTGGLGPTKDDLTKEVICEVLGEPLICYETVVDEMQAYFKRMNKDMPSNNLKQAYFPKVCQLIENNHGTAPGCILTTSTHTIILLPGPPKELQPMVNEVVLPYLKECSKQRCYTKDIQVFGLGESHIAEKINHLLGECEGVSVAPYVGNHMIIIRVKGSAATFEEAKAKVESKAEEVKECLENYVIGYNDSKLEETVAQCLKEKGYTIATAESCTGGMVASTLINCSGISSLLNESIVTYSNEAKHKYLEVKEETLLNFGAVSYETAKEMAEGIKKVSGSAVGLATTGIAGPDGGTIEKPVGLVYLGIALPEKTYIYKLNLVGTRQEIREKATKTILYELYKLIK